MASGFGVTSTNVEGHAVLRETNNRNRQWCFFVFLKMHFKTLSRSEGENLLPISKGKSRASLWV
jgi:hypothetical protein